MRRDLHGLLLRRIADLSDRRASLLVGPRQVGKTTLLLQLAVDLLDRGWPPRNLVYFDFSDDRLPTRISPRVVVDAVPGPISESKPRILLLDEICRSENWSSWLKQSVDRTIDRIIATDSAASVLRHESLESGAGRWDEHVLEGTSFGEYLRLQSRQGESEADVLSRLPNAVNRYLTIGGFPEHRLADDLATVRQRLRDDISDRAIRRDLAQLHPDVEIDQVRRLMVSIAQGSGDIFDAANRAKKLGADPRSVRSWVHLVEETGLVRRLDRRTGSPVSNLASRPKLYAFDPGIITAFCLAASPLDEAGVRGRLWEAAVFRHLREAARELRGEISYLREKNDLEVDFVVDLAQQRVAIEVTTSEDPETRKLRRVRRGAERIGAKIRLAICATPELQSREGIELVPLRAFLLSPGALLSGAGRP